jgi:hypothetical protein
VLSDGGHEVWLCGRVKGHGRGEMHIARRNGATSYDVNHPDCFPCTKDILVIGVWLWFPCITNCYLMIDYVDSLIVVSPLLWWFRD